MVCESLPFYASGLIIKGFGRGSKELGIPTANYSDEVVESLPESIQTGVYYGWAQVDQSPVHKMVMSIGWNPFYNNTKKSMETHIMHKFDGDLYDCNLKTIMLGYIRPERSFNSLDELVAEIKNDIDTATKKLDEPDMIKYKTDAFFEKASEN
ncbi:putative riboflavin kinase [Macrosteles quadrilineatus]|uniref:putative riboflavin kinase n=1 Tax=Macrosteles quadrilineatus TaxID=74068 RepID=UPI0023E23725|nr:putative riboflavin kinase [Macrosteles quadrilineatus]